MGDVLTYCDVRVSHSDLYLSMMIDPKEANNIIPETSGLLACRRFVPWLKFNKVNFHMAAVTLRKGSRSNHWYGTKVMLCTIIWHIEKDLVAKRL